MRRSGGVDGAPVQQSAPAQATIQHQHDYGFVPARWRKFDLYIKRINRRLIYADLGIGVIGFWKISRYIVDFNRIFGNSFPDDSRLQGSKVIEYSYNL